MEKNELTVFEETLNHVITGAFEGEMLQLKNGIYYIGDVPVTESNYERIELADPKEIRQQKEIRKKNIGKDAVGAFAAPVLLPRLIKDLDAFLKTGTLINILWKTGESSLVFIDRQAGAELLGQENGIIGTVKGIAKAFVGKKRRPVMFNDILDGYGLPSVIKVVDDALYVNDAELKGAVGWREVVKDQEVLFLYDEVVKDSGLTLKPNMECDAVYVVHPHDRNTYLMVDSMFHIAHQERLAELKQIAYDLGAVQYSIEIMAEEKASKHVEAKKTEKFKFRGIGGENEVSMKEDDLRRKRIEMTSETIHGGAREPREPKLAWFASNDDIQNLIRNRLSDANRTSFEERVSIKGSTCALLSLNAAGRIGATVKKIEANSSFDFKKTVEDEYQQILQYHLVF